MDPKTCSSSQFLEVALSALRKDEPSLDCDQCWWKPSDRWVAVHHLPIHLHCDNILASLVHQFGSFESASYLVSKEDNNVILVLVIGCIITKIPHCVPIWIGNKCFPVRIQIIVREIADEEGVTFHPLDNGESFFLPPVNSDVPTNSDLTTSVTLSEVTCRKDKGIQICITPTGTASVDRDRSSIEIQGYKKDRDKQSCQADVIGRDPAGIYRTWEQILVSSPVPPSIPKSYFHTAGDTHRGIVPFLDCDLSAEKKLHQAFTSSMSVPMTEVKSTTPSPIHILISSTYLPEAATHPVALKEATKEVLHEVDSTSAAFKHRKSLHRNKPLLVYEGRKSHRLYKASELATNTNSGEPPKVKFSPNSAQKPESKLKNGTSPGQKSELHDHWLMEVANAAMGLNFAANKNEFLKLMESFNSNTKNWTKNAPGQELEDGLKKLGNNPCNDQVSKSGV